MYQRRCEVLPALIFHPPIVFKCYMFMLVSLYMGTCSHDMERGVQEGGASTAAEYWFDAEEHIEFTRVMNALEFPPPHTLQHGVWDTILSWNLDSYNSRDPFQFAVYRKTFAATPVGAALCLAFPLVRNPANGKWSKRHCETSMSYLEMWGEARPTHLTVQCVWMQLMFCGALHGMR